MKLIKHYDFVNQTEINRDEWNIEVGEKWSNKELQHYVDSENNLYFEDGLRIKATLENGVIKSSRINTKSKFSMKYGKIEILAKVPKGLGTWPALWMMPQLAKHGHWPKSGEIDIMEHNGHNLDKLYMCLHTEKYNHRDGDPYDQRVTVEGLSDDFQTFGLLWDETKIQYLLNDVEYKTYFKGEHGKDTSHLGWPFDEEFYFIINLAMGGMFGGDVDMESFPQEFIVKDIKIFK